MKTIYKGGGHKANFLLDTCRRSEVTEGLSQPSADKTRLCSKVKEQTCDTEQAPPN